MLDPQLGPQRRQGSLLDIETLVPGVPANLKHGVSPTEHCTTADLSIVCVHTVVASVIKPVISLETNYRTMRFFAQFTWW